MKCETEMFATKPKSIESALIYSVDKAYANFHFKLRVTWTPNGTVCEKKQVHRKAFGPASKEVKKIGHQLSPF